MSVLLLGLLTGLVLSLLVGSGTALARDLPPGGTFSDDDGNVHEGYIEAIAAEGITRGCGRDKYCPDQSVTRGEMAAFIRRSLSLPTSGADYFGDDDGTLFESDINAIAQAGITTGCRDGSDFCPDDAVSRGEMAAFIRRAGDLDQPRRDQFRDDDGSVFESDINAIAAAGIAAGCNPPDNTRFCPDDPTARDQMASFLGRYLGLTATTPPTRPAPEPTPEPAPPSDPADMPVRDAIRAWFPDIYGQALAVAECESTFNPRAVNPAGYYGLFQIGEFYHRSAFERVTGQSWNDGIFVAYYNAQYARNLYNESNSWRAWSCKP